MKARQFSKASIEKKQLISRVIFDLSDESSNIFLERSVRLGNVGCGRVDRKERDFGGKFALVWNGW